MTDSSIFRGICVSDLDRSTRFYQEALGFAPLQRFDGAQGAEADASTELQNVCVNVQLVRNDQGVTLELLQFERPAPFGPRVRRPNNQYGLTHLAFYVDDIDAVAARIVAAGGEAHPHTRAHFEAGATTMFYCNDPDGIRIELMHSPEQPARFSHSGICVTDPERSAAFYAVLGYQQAENYELTDHPWLDLINEIPGIKLRAQMVRDASGNTIELLHIYQPECIGPLERQPMNKFGLTHLGFWVDDIDGTAKRLAAAGGTILEATRVRRPTLDTLYLTDPDGVRVELMNRP